MTKRPHRQRKGDRILHGGVSAQERECDYAMAPFHRLAMLMDRKWGIDRLPELVDVEMAVKYGKAVSALNDALNAIEPAEVARHAKNCQRGLEAMDRAATAAGRQQAPPEIWEFELDGVKFGICREIEDWPVVQQDRPDLTLIGLREVCVALQFYRSDAMRELKSRFPGAQVTAIRKNGSMPTDIHDGDLNDPIPW